MRSARWGRAWAVVVAVGLAWGCSGADTDGGEDMDAPGPSPLPTLPDGGTAPPGGDGGTLDAGPRTPDGGSVPPDAGTGSPDGGTGAPDGGTAPADAGTPTPPQGRHGTLGFIQQYGGPGLERVRAMASAPDGSLVVLGSGARGPTFGGAVLPEDGDILARYDAQGRHLWSRTLPGLAHAAALAVGRTGDIVLTGEYARAPDFGGGPLPEANWQSPGVFLVRLSADGGHVWSRGLLPTSLQSRVSGNRIAIDDAGDVLLGGVVEGSARLDDLVLEGGRWALYVARFHSGGGHAWWRTLPEGFLHLALAADASGNVLVGGQAPADAQLDGQTFPGAGRAPYVASLGAGDGRLRWGRVLRGLGGSVQSLARGDDGSIAFLGAAHGGATTFAGAPLAPAPGADTENILVGSLTAEGADRWARVQGGADMERPVQVTADPSGGVGVLLYGDGETDLGGGPMGTPGPRENYEGDRQYPFLARYRPDGTHDFSRALDRTLLGPAMAAQPDGSLVVGANLSSSSVTLEGRTFTPAGKNREGDVLLIQLRP